MREENLAESIRLKNKAFEEDLERLSERVEKLRVLYDRYFMGLERIPPDKVRVELERDIRNSELRKSHKTVYKFKYNNIRQRMTTYRRYWERILRMIEEGTFKRDKNALGQMNETMRPPGPAASQQDPEASGPAARDEGSRMRELYDSWTAARAKVGAAANLDFERFRSKIEQQRQTQREQHGWADVDYQVRVRDGKVAMVARPLEREPDEDEA